MDVTGSKPTILLTGATGFVGRRLLLELESRGGRVRCLARTPEALRLAYWYALLPIHRIVFRGMLRAISRTAAVQA